MKTNILLFISVLCLSLILYFEPGLEQPEKQYLSSLNSQQIQHITIQRKGLESIELDNTDQGWFISKPYQLAANPLRIGTITALAEKRSFSQFPAAGKLLKKYQLDDPLITVSLDDKKIAIGAEEPINQHRYALLDDMIHLIDGTVYYQLRANLDTFISLYLLPPGSEIQSIELPEHKISIEEGKWLLSPEDHGISADSISTLLHSWKAAQALRIKIGSAPSSTDAEVISISLQDQTQIRYRVAGDAGNPELIRLPWNIVYQITPQLLEQLTRLTPPSISD